MRRILVLALAASVLAVSPATALAQTVPATPSTSAPRPAPPSWRARPSIGFLSAAELNERCASTSASVVSYCFAYITGVHDTVQAYETWLKVREFCPPYFGAQADMRRAFVDYLASHPEAGSGEAASVIVLALKDKFPCTVSTSEKGIAPTKP